MIYSGPSNLKKPRRVSKKKKTRDPMMFHRFCQAMVEFGQAKPSLSMGISVGKPSLVGGAITILKNMSSSMGRMTSHILWKIKAMFETTNHLTSGL
jgi:hypothetical protein